MSYLCITIRWLDDRYHGQNGNGAPEWPPSPLRLFQALVAAACRGGAESERDLASLRWLEGKDQAAPLIIAPRAQPGSAFTRFVPNNDSDRQFDRQERLTGKAVCPTLLLDDCPIRYLWALPEPATGQVLGCSNTVCDIARRIVALGWGIDMAVGRGEVIPDAALARLVGERWLPADEPSAGQYRAPRSGSVDALLDRHHAFVNRLHTGYLLDVPPLKESAFRVVGYRRVTDVRVSRAPVAFKLLEADTDRFATFSLTEANSVAAMMRHATATAARHEPKEWVDAYVHGHQPDGTKATPRFSYLPLPSIEQRGRGAQVMSAIRRLLLAELVEAPESYLSWARRRLPGEGLIEEGSAAPAAILAPLSEGDWVLRQYTRASENWASATPVVLPGSDEGKLGKAKKLLAKALRHAGYCPDALAEAEFRNESFWPGGSPALRFRRPEYLKKGCWSVYHLRLRWHRPVSGPIALGAGRHCGLGVFASLDT